MIETIIKLKIKTDKLVISFHVIIGILSTPTALSLQYWYKFDKINIKVDIQMLYHFDYCDTYITFTLTNFYVLCFIKIYLIIK